MTPYYNRPSQDGLYHHFEAIANATSLPIMLYNVPKRTGVHLTAETTVQLAQISNIVATKEASGDLDTVTQIIHNTPESFLVYSGDDSMVLPVMSVGGYGVVSVASHVIGKQMKEMLDAYLAGRIQEAARLHQQLHPVFTGLFTAPNPVPVKFALSLHGIDVGGVRLPLYAANNQEQDAIRALFPDASCNRQA